MQLSSSRLALFALAAASVVLLAVHGESGASGTLEGGSDASRVLRVAVCQTFCIDGDIEGNLRRIEYAVQDAARQNADIACFAETAVIGWINPAAHELATTIPGELSDRIATMARAHNIMLSIGLCEKEGNALYDSAVLLGPDGEILLKHRKINILTELMDPPYTCGDADDIRVVDTPIGRVGLIICADCFREENIKALGEQKPELITIPYGWAADRSEWPEHGKRLAARVASVASRTHCPVVGTDLVGVISSGPWKGKTYGGQSVVADEAGEILATLRDRDAEVKVVEILIGGGY